VPGFSFAKGNAQKLATIPLYALGAAASLVVRRSNRRWAFGSGAGLGEGSLALFLHAAAADPSLTLVWLCRNDVELAAASTLGLPAVRRDSFRGLLATLRSGVVVVTHGFGDVNRYGSRGSFLVQLWHGVPLKLVQLDSPATLAVSVPVVGRQVRALLRRFYRRAYRAISFMPASSELVADRLRSAFNLPADRVVATGDPRDDVLCSDSASDRAGRARDLLREGVDSLAPRVLLYAPTWRDGERDPAVPVAEDWPEIDAWLRAADATLVLRPHPLGLGGYAAFARSSDRVQLLTADRRPDITPILPAVDLLITDYSSIAFDYSLTGGPILFLAPDEDAYVLSRGLYEPYREFSDGRAVRNWRTILAQLVRYDADPVWASTVREHSVALRDRHFAHRDGRNTERVYAEILRRLNA
jgi:CDP-glycerol glycerophosphotransferase (TagB/SpsB family)